MRIAKPMKVVVGVGGPTEEEGVNADMKIQDWKFWLEMEGILTRIFHNYFYLSVDNLIMRLQSKDSNYAFFVVLIGRIRSFYSFSLHYLIILLLEKKVTLEKND